MKKKKIVLKFISLILSLTLWFYVISSSPVERIRKIHLNLEIPQKYSITNNIPRNINIIVKGPRLFLNEINKRTILSYSIDRHEIIRNKKKMKIYLNKGELLLPLGVQLLKVEPEFLNLRFGKKIRKWLRPKFDISKVDKDKYNIKKIQFSHKKVLVEGAYKYLKDKTYIRFGEVNFDFTEPNTWFEPESIEKQQFELMTKKLRVKVNFGPNSSNKKFNKLKIFYFSSNIHFISKLKYADVEIFQTKLTDTFTSNDIKIFTEIPENAKGKIRIKLKAKLPEGVHLVKITPEIIDVIIE